MIWLSGFPRCIEGREDSQEHFLRRFHPELQRSHSESQESKPLGYFCIFRSTYSSIPLHTLKSLCLTRRFPLPPCLKIFRCTCRLRHFAGIGYGTSHRKSRRRTLFPPISQ